MHVKAPIIFVSHDFLQRTDALAKRGVSSYLLPMLNYLLLFLCLYPDLSSSPSPPLHTR